MINYPFSFNEDPKHPINGSLELEIPLPYPQGNQGSALYRPGRIRLENGTTLELVLYHNPATSEFIYLHRYPFDRELMDLLGLPAGALAGKKTITLPGQLCMGARRSQLIGSAVDTIFHAPQLQEVLNTRRQHNMAIFPIAREGLKYGVAESIFHARGYYCDEVLLDAHHVFDMSVPVYNRKVELGIFKDKDLDRVQHENITAAFIADSIASGLVMREVISHIRKRFENIEHVEVISPLATIRGLCRVAEANVLPGSKIRVHVFETVFNALPPDYYYSAHYDALDLHIKPNLESEYRAWWGFDAQGNEISATACAGYGWSEVFYSPRKQVEMINGELRSRHNLTIADIVQRNNPV
jgi:hypothetical protein